MSTSADKIEALRSTTGTVSTPAIGDISRAYLEAAIDCVVVADAKGCVVEFNPAAERTFGYTREQALGRTLAELIVPPSLRERHSRAFERFAESAVRRLFGKRLELVGRRADGSEFPVELALSVIETEPLLVCGALRDLSDAKRTETDLRTLADEQAALRRVATLVARQAMPAEVFAAVAEESARMLAIEQASVLSLEPDGSARLLGTSAPRETFTVGDTYPPHPGVIGEVRATGLPATVDYAAVSGPIAARLRSEGMEAALGVPIAVDGATWGLVIALATRSRPLPADAEARLVAFTELVAFCISNAEARDGVRQLAEEQAALRRVATMIARQASPADVLAAVAEEVARTVGAPLTAVVRFEPDGTATQVGAWGAENPFPVGTSWVLDEQSVSGTVSRTGRAARVDDYAEIPGGIAATLARDAGIRTAVGVPVLVESRPWGVIMALSTEQQPLAEGTEDRLAAFTELIATAIANTQARDEIRELADEQAALRRVATLVARGTDARAVFDAVCEETGRLIGAGTVNLAHFTPDGFNLTMSGWSLRDTHIPTGTHLRLGEGTINDVIQRTRAPARVDGYEHAAGDLADLIRRRGIRSEVGAPVIVEGRVWGGLIAGMDTDVPLPAGAERRVASFAELIGTAVANATSRSELIASRARIVAAGDEARRRIERNLHDGTQQRLVSLGLDLQAVRAAIPAGEDDTRSALARIGREIEGVLEDVRELSRGLHPALLAQGGLLASLRALARKSPVPVELDVDIETRPPESVEIATYFVVSEALTNTAKHARASRITVAVNASGGFLHATIADDGAGGAEASAGSGIVGLIDRVEALGGRLALESTPGEGTRITIELPLVSPSQTGIASFAASSWHERRVPFAATAELADVAGASALLSALASVADALYVVDARGRIHYLDDEALRILGYDDKAQLLGRPSHDTIHHTRPDGTPFPVAECPLLRPRLTGETVRVEDDWFVRQDGSLVHVAYSSAPIALADGRGAVVSFRKKPGREGRDAP